MFSSRLDALAAELATSQSGTCLVYMEPFLLRGYMEPFLLRGYMEPFLLRGYMEPFLLRVTSLVAVAVQCTQSRPCLVYPVTWRMSGPLNSSGRTDTRNRGSVMQALYGANDRAGNLTVLC